MSGTLFVVATPIGNLEDITLRALRVLREAHVIAAEDTRRTAKLLTHHGISTPTLSFHRHNTQARLPRILARLDAGTRVALVTDAGTPGISDPAVELVRACIDRGIAVEPVPGPSAPLTAAMASGFPLEPLTMLGFAPYRSKDRIKWLEHADTIPHTFIFFEAPHRIRLTIMDISKIFGDRPICVGRELTKVHQQFINGTASSIVGQLTDLRGEFTIVIGPDPTSHAIEDVVTDEQIALEFGLLTQNSALGRRAVVASLAKKYGRSSKSVYNAIERAKNSVA